MGASIYGLFPKLKMNELTPILKPFLLLVVFINVAIFSSLGIQAYMNRQRASDSLVHNANSQSYVPTEGEEVEQVKESSSSSTIDVRNYDLLRKDIEDILDSGSGAYAVSIKNLESDEGIVVNGEVKLVPASLIKVPLALLFIKDIEEERFYWDTVITLEEDAKAYESDFLYSKEPGSEYTVEYLIDLMLRNSDNTAMNMIYREFYTTDEINTRFDQDLELPDTRHAPFVTTAVDMEHVFEILYFNLYLSRENSAYVLDILSNVPAGFNNRIVAGVPSGTKVAHKIGNLDNVYQDAGIVYSDSGDYIIVVLANNVTYQSAQATIQAVSSATWSFFQDP